MRRWRGVADGERPLAGADAEDGTVVVATRDALFLTAVDGPVRRVAWEEVQDAQWDPQTHTFRISEVGVWGEARPEHTVVLHDATVLLEFIRERVTSSIVLQQDVFVRGHGGVRVIARRAPGTDAPVRWLVEYDVEVDPAAEEVRSAVAVALAQARDDVGSG